MNLVLTAKTLARSRVTDRGIGVRFLAGTDTFLC